MHYLIYVLVPNVKNLESQVNDLMSNHQSQFDWWQIGGRWTGSLDGYDPEKDPANQEPCMFCDATGIRKDAVGEVNKFPTLKLDEDVAKVVGRTHGYCNGCRGLGTKVKWPTQWAKHQGDVMPAKDVMASEQAKHNQPCYVIWDQEILKAPMSWVEDKEKEAAFQEKLKEVLQMAVDKQMYVVAVDAHS